MTHAITFMVRFPFSDIIDSTTMWSKEIDQVVCDAGKWLEEKIDEIIYNAEKCGFSEEDIYNPINNKIFGMAHDIAVEEIAIEFANHIVKHSDVFDWEYSIKTILNEQLITKDLLKGEIMDLKPFYFSFGFDHPMANLVVEIQAESELQARVACKLTFGEFSRIDYTNPRTKDLINAPQTARTIWNTFKDSKGKEFREECEHIFTT